MSFISKFPEPLEVTAFDLEFVDGGLVHESWGNDLFLRWTSWSCYDGSRVRRTCKH